MINGIKIMNLEGSDILKNNLEGRIIKKEYNGVFTNSLLQDKLTTLGLKISNKETTRDIITVQFTYGYTPLLDNLNTEDIKILKEENDKIKHEIKSLEKEKKLISKRADKKPIIEKINALKSSLKNNKVEIGSMQIEDEVSVAEVKMDTDQIRDKLYKNGFKLEFKGKNSDKKDIIEYVLWYRTPSKSRVGDAVFINKKLYKDIKAWQRMGLELPEGEAKVVEIAAYEALTSSNIIDKIKLDPYKNILVIDDIVSLFETNCNIVKTNDKGECYVSPELYKVSNTLFDGQALLDDSMFSDDSSFKLLRQHFFKACAFRTYIKEFMKDSFKESYDTATVKDRYGNDIKVSEILLITTENAMKWEKFQDIGASYDLWRQKVSEDNNVFGIVKVDHISKYNNLFGDGKCYQRMSYQHVNTLCLEQGKEIDEMRELLQDTIRFINKLKSDNEYFLQYLERNANEVNANQMVIDLYKNINNFDKSAFFRAFKNEAINKYVETVRNGKVLTTGDNLTVVGNPYIMLLHAIGKVPVKDGVLDDNYQDETLPISDEYISVYAPLFENGEYLASFRNPHNSPNNCGFNRNYKHPFMIRYFNFNNSIMAVNMIHTEEQDLKNGEDQDSDFCYVSNNRIAVLSAQRVFRKFPCIVNKIEKENRFYENSIDSLVTIDNELAKSKYDIGLSSNLAQLAMSWYWMDKTKDLAEIVCIMSVIAQCAIDNSKCKYAVSIRSELERISNLECMNKKIKSIKGRDIKAKPKFWEYVSSKTREDSLVECPCPMNFLQDVLDTDVECASKTKDTIPSMNFINIISGKADDRQMAKIEAKIKEYDDAVKRHNDMIEEGYAKEDDKKWKVEEQILQKGVVDYISGLKIKQKTMQILIAKALSKNGMNSKYKRKLLNSLYKSYREKFMNCFKSL
jgi:hypothetical protein